MAFCDGSVKVVNYSVDTTTHRYLGSRNDGVPIDGKNSDAFPPARSRVFRSRGRQAGDRRTLRSARHGTTIGGRTFWRLRWIRASFIPTTGGLTADRRFGMFVFAWSGGCSVFRQSFSSEESLSCYLVSEPSVLLRWSNCWS